MTEQPLTAVLELSGLGQRLAGSASERAAIDALGRWFEERGEEVRYEGFVECSSPPLNAAIHLLAAGLAAAAGALSPLAGALLMALTLVSSWRELTGRRPLLRRLLPKDTSYNLLVRRLAAGRRRGTLVLLFHVDLPRPLPRLTRRLLALPSAAAALAGLALTLQALGIHWFWLGWVSGIGGALLVLMAAFAFAQSARGPQLGPGRADAGAAAAMEAWLALKERPLQHLDLIAAVVGSQEAHGGGVRALLRQHAHRWTPEDTALIAVEGAGPGLCYGVGERLVSEVSYRPTLPGVAERVARQSPWVGVGGLMVGGVTGALLPTREGYRALSVTAEPPPEGAPDPGQVRRCAAFVAEIAALYDADLGAGAL